MDDTMWGQDEKEICKSSGYKKTFRFTKRLKWECRSNSREIHELVVKLKKKYANDNALRYDDATRV